MTEENTFHVSYYRTPTLMHTVVCDEHGPRACSCRQMTRWGLPCRHAIAVVRHMLTKGLWAQSQATAAVRAMVNDRWLLEGGFLLGMQASALVLVSRDLEVSKRVSRCLSALSRVTMSRLLLSTAKHRC